MAIDDPKIDPDKDPEIYIPEIKKEKVLDIDQTDYESDLDSVMDKDGFIKTKLNEEVIIQRISHDLYKDSTSGLRELLNNEIRACQIARDKFNTKPYIKVSLNQLDRKLTIQGFNSLGITEKIFTKVLLILGNSGNLDSKAIGQFGMGFASYTTLSDIMILQTSCIEKNSKGDQDCYSVMAKGGLGFQKLPKPRLENTGTKLTLTLREKTNYTALIDMLLQISKTSGIKTHLELQLHEDKKLAGFESGLHTLEQTTFKEIFEGLNQDKNSSYLKTSLINEDVEIYLSLSAQKNGYINNNRRKNIFLCNSPIVAKLDSNDHDYNDHYETAEIDKIQFTNLVVNIKDERKFKPMPERERLTTEAENKLKEILIDLYNNMIKKGIRSCPDLDTWFNHEHKNFILNNDEFLTRNFDEQTKEVSKVLNLEVFEHEPTYRKTKYDHKPLKEIVKNKTQFKFYIGKRDKRIKNLLDENRSDHSMIVIHSKHSPYKDQEEKYNEAVKTLKKHGFIEAKQYLIDNKIKAQRSTAYNKIEKTYDEISIHQTIRSDSWYDRNTIKDEITTIKIEDISNKDYKNKIIMVKPFSEYRQILKQVESEYYLTVEKKELNNGIKTVNDIQKEIEQQSFNTNHGKKTLTEIIKQYDKDTLIELNDCYSSKHSDKNKIDNIEQKIKALNFVPKVDNNKAKVIHILDSSNNLFKLSLVFIKNKIDYQVTNRNLDYYYRGKVEDLEKTVKLHNDYEHGKKLDVHNFNDVFHFEEYLLTLNEIEKTIKNPTLLKLFQLSKDQNNFKDIAKDVMRLEKCC